MKKLRSSFSETYKLCTVSLYCTLYCTPVKRELLKIPKTTTFRNIPCTCVRFLNRTQKFLLLYLNMIPPQTNFKILEANKGNICGGVSFRIVIGGWIGQFEFFKRNATKDIFLIIFQNFLNSSFSNIPWKKIFFSWYSDILDCRAVALEKKRQFRKDFL